MYEYKVFSEDAKIWLEIEIAGLPISVQSTFGLYDGAIRAERELEKQGSDLWN